jgi:hypothetical protein
MRKTSSALAKRDAADKLGAANPDRALLLRLSSPVTFSIVTSPSNPILSIFQSHCPSVALWSTTLRQLKPVRASLHCLRGDDPLSQFLICRTHILVKYQFHAVAVSYWIYFDVLNITPVKI